MVVLTVCTGLRLKEMWTDTLEEDIKAKLVQKYRSLGVEGSFSIHKLD